MARNKQIEIKVSLEEHERLKSKAEYFGMNISSYLRFIGLNAKIEITS